jgi:hypothetical protein
VDGATIFVYVLSATFFGFIALLAVTSRRRHHAEAIKPEAQRNIESLKSEDKKPRNAA